MGEDALGHVDAGSHQQRRPDHGVEAEDVLAYDVIRGPAAGEGLLVGSVADGSRVIEQCVDPHVDDVRLVPGQRDAPVEGRARDGEILQALRDERDDLVASGVRAHEVGLVLVELEQAVLELAQLEEVVLLLQQLERLGVDRADLQALEGSGAVDDLRLWLELLTTHAVERLVLARVDVARVVQPLEEHLHVLLMALLRGADEVVVGDVERLQQREPALGDELVHPLLRRDVVRRCGAEHLLAVLVGAGQHPGVIAAVAVPTRERVDGHRCVPVADVGHIGGVVDGRGDVEGFA